MIEIYRDLEMTRLGHYQSLLESEGIKTFVKNEAVSGAEAAIPVFAPTLCVVNEVDQERAKEIIQTYSDPPVAVTPPDVQCGACGETSPGNFAECWNCRASLVEQTGLGKQDAE